MQVDGDGEWCREEVQPRLRESEPVAHVVKKTFPL